MELLDQVNGLLQQGYTVEQASTQLGKGKEWARRTLSAMGYKYNRKTNQYELKSIVPEGKEQAITRVVTSDQKQEITKVVTDSYIEQKTGTQQVFKDDDLNILYKMIEEYKMRHDISTHENIDDKLVNRNIRVYENHYKNFANYCKSINVTQADMLRKAIDLLMSN